MYVIVNVTGGQGFLPEDVKGNVVRVQAFAQDIVDRYCDIDYYDEEATEYYEIPSLWCRLKLWIRVCPFLKQGDVK